MHAACFRFIFIRGLTNLFIMVTVQLILFIYLTNVRSSEQLRVGGLFEEDETDARLVFHMAVMNTSGSRHQYLMPVIGRAYRYNPHYTARSVCALMQDGIVGIVGPTCSYSAPHIESLCDMKDIPLIQIHWDALRRNDSGVNIHPHPSDLLKCFVDMVKALEWKNFGVYYENDESLLRIAPLLEMYNNTGYTITLRQLRSPTDNYRRILLTAKKSGERYFILDCSLHLLEEVLKQAQQVGMMTEQYNYIILNLDLATLDLFPYQYGGANITGVRMVNPSNPRVAAMATGLRELREAHGSFQDYGHLSPWTLTFQTALIADAVHLLHETLKELKISDFDVDSLYCNMSGSWERGLSIVNYMKATTINGVTGVIKFDPELGVRNDFTLEIINLTPRGLLEIGTWNSKEGLNITKPYDDDTDMLRDQDNPLRHKMFKIITALTPPYGMFKNVSSALNGNDQYEGYVIDLIEEIARLLGFNYTFLIQEDAENGSYNSTTREWDGMIGEVTKGNAHFAITDLTISSEREKFVDFTMPFMTLGISILYRKPEPTPPTLLTFAAPFSVEVWALLAVSYFLVSLCFFIMGRLTPSEWANPYPCIEEPEFLINQFNLKNCLWFTVGSLMQQGTDFAPLGISTRMAAGVWWFFTLVLVSTYTANLAACLTVVDLVTPFKNVEELAAQRDIKYGAKAKGATYRFFQNSNFSVYPQIRDYMSSHPEYLTTGNEKGVERVEMENYAFFMESTTIEYVTERHCNLTQVGGALDEKGYGIAMEKNSSYRHFLTEAILTLQENGKLDELKRKWWKEKRGGGACTKPVPVATPLDLQNVGGVFFVLGMGTLFGILGTFVEVSWHTYRKSRKRKLSFRKEIKKELEFFMKFKQRTKDVHTQESDDASLDSTGKS